MTEQLVGGKLFILIVGFAIVMAILSVVTATGLSAFVDSRPNAYAPTTAESIGRLWTIAFSSMAFVFGLVGGRL